ncbi:uncharacterized protein AB675_954 [Cyphellophora attinorum]|uniref:Uncharacterized protein n=1 Tax=Cyphellophora attinorum TaxID=1664694 RepID=A0A0N0NS36_9EURO|nr:uncharacterized protein AB675_954 [Phialophora attinorum]KPI45801.1 hypothetical protein AB675_954 [Phialophora attinorum]
MPVIAAIADEHDNRKGSKGARALYQISLDRVANAMLNEPKSYELIMALPWKLQQDLWTHVLEDRRKRQLIEGELAVKKASMPLMDWEVYAGIDKNAEFNEAHPEEVVTGDEISKYNKDWNDRCLWRKFLKLADVSLPVEKVWQWHLKEENTLFVYEKSASSSIRYGCTLTKKLREGISYHWMSSFPLVSRGTAWTCCSMRLPVACTNSKLMAMSIGASTKSCT